MNAMNMGPHKREIEAYLRGIGAFDGLSQNQAHQRFDFLGRTLAHELHRLGGEAAFIVENGAGSVLGIAVADHKTGLSLVSLDIDEFMATVSSFGRLTNSVVVKKYSVDSARDASYQLTIKHESLPSGGLVHKARTKEALDTAQIELAKAFGHEHAQQRGAP